MLVLWLLLAAALHAAAASGFLAAPASVPRALSSHAREEFMMRSQSKFGAMAGAVALSLSGVSFSQDAVQWRTDQGGNGHWYQGIVQPGVTWTEARAASLSLGGDLVCFGSPAESAFVYAAVASNPTLWNNRIGPWIGLFQNPGSPEPAGGWGWIDGTPLSFANWFADHPIDTIGSGPACNVAHYTAFPVMPADSWGVDPDFHYPAYHWENFRSYLVEWSADCNGDGVVDFGQIRAGELADINANNIPDCCESPLGCCPGDIVDDDVVNGVDLAAVLSNWGTSGGKLGADVNGDGNVNGQDLAIVLSGWGPCE